MKINKCTYTQRVNNQEDLNIEIDITDNPETNLKNILEIKRFIDKLSIRLNDENQRKQEYMRCLNVVKSKQNFSMKVVNDAQKYIDEYERDKNT